MRNQANVSDVECASCTELKPCLCQEKEFFPFIETYTKAPFPFTAYKFEECQRPYTAQMALADRDNRRYDVLRIERGKALEIFEFLGRAQGTLFRMQELHLPGTRQRRLQLQADIARSIQRLHLVVEYLTPSLEKEQWKT